VPAERRVRQNLGGIAVEQIAPPVLAPHVDRTRKDDSHVTELLHVLVQPPLPHELLSLRVNEPGRRPTVDTEQGVALVAPLRVMLGDPGGSLVDLLCCHQTLLPLLICIQLTHTSGMRREHRVPPWPPGLQLLDQVLNAPLRTRPVTEPKVLYNWTNRALKRLPVTCSMKRCRALSEVLNVIYLVWVEFRTKGRLAQTSVMNAFFSEMVV
jgi:hypothetical protein